MGEAFTAANPVGSLHASAAVAAIVVALIALSMLFFNNRLVSKTFGTEPVGAGGSGSRAAGATMLGGVAVLPGSGGMGDQPAALMDAFDILDAASRPGNDDAGDS